MSRKQPLVRKDYSLNDPTLLDIECFKDFFLIAFKNLKTGKTAHYAHPDLRMAAKIMAQKTTVSFNGIKYDLPMLAAALQGYSTQNLKKLSDRLIQSGEPHWKICRDLGIEVPDFWDHVDLIEVSPGTMASLKIYAGRMGSKRMQNLPYEHDADLTEEQMLVVTDYCINDLQVTEDLFNNLKGQIDLRISMSEQYGIDLRSKSDAQIAEAVLKSETLSQTGVAVRKIDVPVGTKMRYRDPGFISFESEHLKELFAKLLDAEFEIGDNGRPDLPDWLKKGSVTIANAKYKIGVGGIHSQESCQCVRADDEMVLSDFDVASYYPNIILQQRMSPPGVGSAFIPVYQSLVDRRIKAKRDGDKVSADSLKVTANGSFGKLGSKYSFLYAPQLLIQVTLTGQLALLMLIEKLEAAGAQVKSANTDGIVVYYKRADEHVVEGIMFDWMMTTTYELERTDYKIIAARDVNNYVAVTTTGKVKRKGVFTSAGLMKNPDREVIYDAVAEHIAKGTDIAQSIRGCTDIGKFLTVRTVNGGAVWQDQLLGKAIRFYHSSEVSQDVAIHYATNGNKVPVSNGCRPLMEMPKSFPKDVDYDYYIAAAQEILEGTGYA